MTGELNSSPESEIRKYMNRLKVTRYHNNTILILVMPHQNHHVNETQASFFHMKDTKNIT